MTYTKQNWFIDTFFPKRIVPIDPVVHQIGHTAVAEALATSETLESPEAAKLRADLVAAGAPVKVPALPPITAAQPGTPEYHLGLMNQMIETLAARIQRAETKRADQRKAYDTDKHQRALEQERSDMEQAAEIAGLVKSLEAYKAAHDVLNPPMSPAAVDPIRLTAVGERIAETKRAARRRPTKSIDDAVKDGQALPATPPTE